MSEIRLCEGRFGWDYLLLNEDNGESELIQTDLDYPRVASIFGWSPCHRETDGTVDCPVCGKTALELIGEAQQFLDDHIGDVATTDD